MQSCSCSAADLTMQGNTTFVHEACSMQHGADNFIDVATASTNTFIWCVIDGPATCETCGCSPGAFHFALTALLA